jgi:hypothetical protein
MSSKDASHRKRKPPQHSDPFSDTDERTPKNSKARKMSLDASPSTSASLQIDTPAATEEATTVNSAAATTTEDDDVIKRIGKMIQDLAHSDNAKVNAALDALFLGLAEKDKKQCDNIQAVGGCLALLQLLHKYLDKTIAIIPACDQVIELNELAELTTLHKTLSVIIRLTFLHEESKVGITAIGGVEAVVKVMKTFPRCQTLQEYACRALANLTYKNVTGKKQATESGGCLVLVQLMKNTLDVITNVTHQHEESKVGITAVGGVEAVVKVMKTFPKCQVLQERACRALFNLTYSNVTGKKQVIESSGCLVLVQLMKNCLDMAIDRIPMCDQVTELNEDAELKTLDKTLRVITNLTHQH